MQTLRALVFMAVENKGEVVINLSKIARLRGWDASRLDRRTQPGRQSRRERLREHVGLLRQVEIQFSVTDKRTRKYRSHPLLCYDGRVGLAVDDRRIFDSAVFKLHPLLWDEMVQRGRALFYDPAILTADPKSDEWSIRILSYLDSRWGPNWVSKRLDETGGRMTERLVVILDRAGIKYEKQLQAQGKPWLRRTFQVAMQKLLKWQPNPLIGGYQQRGDTADPLDERITFWPTDDVAASYTAAWSETIAKRNRKVNDPGHLNGRA